VTWDGYSEEVGFEQRQNEVTVFEAEKNLALLKARHLDLDFN
jgi:hypothetical protein